MDCVSEWANCRHVDCNESRTNDKRPNTQASQQQCKKANDEWDRIAKEWIADGHDAYNRDIRADPNV